MKRLIILILDSVGIGELPDASNYGDQGSNTLGNIAASIPGFSLPNLEILGLGNINGMRGIKPTIAPKACYGKMAEKSPGKDTTTGHWEIAGIIMDRPFPVYPRGFPREVMHEFERAINKKTLGNIPASGTEIINILGDEHLKTGYPIVYTSADSVFQIAAHEDIIPITTLYKMCGIARKILKGDHAVGRVIARPFTGEKGHYERTDKRRDFSLDPIKKTILEYVTDSGYKVKAVGKIEDIFNKRGITDSVHIHGNMDGVNKTLEYMKKSFEGILFTNLVDFDMLYGHRNDVMGYAKALKEFDNRIPDILARLRDDDLLIITADHGCDPTTKGTDHSREYVPLLVYGKRFKGGVNLGTRASFADVAQTASHYFGIGAEFGAESFLDTILEK